MDNGFAKTYDPAYNQNIHLRNAIEILNRNVYIFSRYIKYNKK